MSLPEGAFWNRRCQVVTGTGGNGILVEDPLKITAEITKTLERTPNTALIKLYNLSPDTEAKVKGEFDEVIVIGGYGTNMLQVFRGNIRHTAGGRDGNDRIFEIDAADGDRDFREAFVTTTIGPNSSQGELLSTALASMVDTVKGYIGVPDRKFIRGRTFVGLARDLLDDIAGYHDANWSIQDGQLQIVPAQSTLPTEAFVINADTGMLGSPELDDKGIRVSTLFNPHIQPNGKIWLDNNDILLRVRKQKESKPGAQTTSPKKKRAEFARLDPDGVYKVYKVVHHIDTRGPAKTDIYGIGLGKPIPSTAVAA